ncbi:DUF4157 domain-containing protein [Ancylobacter sp. Lp-2]|uniref:eCIS core domain-containing protein n=1 Tax=Ancylobacter sp. Lp-2 TaxID=2881339 RepID=UPI001E2CF6A5|nr:DUF4157 domain-containing protein [Ancylobacter sp. Lp-2]MCB4768059.1 DUF4157 domain-containing protein [Ancylobacter sp. Lp-2]
MARHMRIRRKVRRGHPPLRRAPQGSALALRAGVRQGGEGGGGLMIGGIQDPAEKAADRMADRVMRMNAAVVHRKCAECEAEEKESKRPVRAPEEDDRTVERKSAPGVAPVAAGAAPAAASTGATRAIGALDGGRPMASAERAFFEPRMGMDLSAVRLHEGRAADRASHAIDARAFTLGKDIAFAHGEYQPGTEGGRRLLAHELAHAVGEGEGRVGLRRKPKAPDPLCTSYKAASDLKIAEGCVDKLAAKDDTELRLALVRALKIIHRCASEDEKKQIRSYMNSKLGEKSARQIWEESQTVFGGYRGSYPGYYSGGKTRLQNLGVKEAIGFKPFDYPEEAIDDTIFQPRAEKSAKAMAKTIEATDILYFYGHQYAQYGNPGAFANGAQDQFVDLRELEGEGKFDRVKLIISTSCATICKEALDVFTKLFPKAVILGYRKSAPIKGDKVRDSFDSAIKSLKKPLLLDKPVDVSAIISVWKSVVEQQHPNESERLPGYYQNGTVNYLKDSKWGTISGSDAANSCKKKGTQIQQAR